MNSEHGLLPPPDPTRHDRVWAHIDENLDAPRAMQWRRPAFALAAIAAAAVAFVFWPKAAPSWQNTEVVSGETSQQLTLADGSSVVLAPESRVGMCAPNSTCLTLLRGEAEFQVKKQSHGPFRVLAGNVEVRVVGTRFTVKKHGDEALNASVEVAVKEGRVDVYVGVMRVAALEPGQRWSTTVEQAEPNGALDASTELPDTNVRFDEPDASKPLPHATMQPALKPVKEPTADERWSAALAARLSGETGKEAAAYLQLVTRYPNDARAGVAAFELARMQLDEQNNPRGAIRMLELALAKGPAAPYVEDALMRLAGARATTGDEAGCRAARERYLRSFPRGVHTAAVRRLCP